MQFLGRKKKVTLNQQNELYDHCLQFYCQPPLENISLTEFECFAVDRLKRKILHTSSVFWNRSTILVGDESVSHHNSLVLLLILIVLKVVENLGVSCVKMTEQYTKKLHTEFSSLGFPYKLEMVRKCSN